MVKTARSMICFAKSDLKFWNEFLHPESFFNTAGSFIKAHRPYWDYYLNALDEVCLLSDESVCEDEHLQERLLQIDQSGKLVRGLDSRLSALRNYYEESKNGEVIILSTEKRALRFGSELKKALPGLRLKKVFVLPEKIAGIELEPSWYLLKEYLSQHRPALIISCLGWESVVYAARVKDIYGANYFDWGDSAEMNGVRYCLKDEIKRIVKKILKRK